MAARMKSWHGWIALVMAVIVRSWQEASTTISTAIKETIMSMKLTNPDEKPEKTAVMAEKSGSTSESWQLQEVAVKPNQPSGKANIPAMTESEAIELLARIQDICAVYPESHNKIFENYLLVAFPIPTAMIFSKMVMADGKTTLCVNGKPVMAVMAGEK